MNVLIKGNSVCMKSLSVLLNDLSCDLFLVAAAYERLSVT